jgi:invasion protein IalB
VGEAALDQTDAAPVPSEHSHRRVIWNCVCTQEENTGTVCDLGGHMQHTVTATAVLAV